MEWRDIAPKDAVDINCRERPDLNPPRNENGEVCPWPWEPQQLVDYPLGQYHCPYCMAMVMAGMEHLDYSPSPCEKCGEVIEYDDIKHWESHREVQRTTE